MNNQPIGFFDSGVGLISVLKETQKLLPKENFVIYADQGHNPYGEKTRTQIKKYAKDATSLLVKKHNIKMMVLACNTATVLALDSLRKSFDIPFIGTVPAVKPAILKSKKLKIAIVSTPVTAKSSYLKNLIKEFSLNAEVLNLGCPGLEEAIEILDLAQIDKQLKKYLKKVKEFKADVLVLGCTHYPLVKKRISKILGREILVIDSGQAIAQRIKSVLAGFNKLSKSWQKNFYYTTGNSKLFSKVASTLLQSKIEAQKIDVLSK